MPKVKLTDRQCDHERWRANLQAVIGRDSMATAGKSIGKTDKTFAGRLNNPGMLTLDELSDFCRHYNISRVKFLETLLKDEWK